MFVNECGNLDRSMYKKICRFRIMNNKCSTVIKYLLNTGLTVFIHTWTWHNITMDFKNICNNDSNTAAPRIMMQLSVIFMIFEHEWPCLMFLVARIRFLPVFNSPLLIWYQIEFFKTIFSWITMKKHPSNFQKLNFAWSEYIYFYDMETFWLRLILSTEGIL